MKQLLHVQLGALLLASTITSSLSTSPSNGFLDTCESKFLSSDTVSRNDYTTGIFSFVMYDLVVNKGLNNDVYDDTVLRNKLLRDDGSPRNGYSNYLPPYEALPEAVMDVFTDFSCQLYDGSGSTKIGKFCNKYLNGMVNATDTPKTAFIAVSKLKQKKAMTVANETCITVSNNWNDLINNAIQYYLDEGLITSLSTTLSPSPNPVSADTSKSPSPSLNKNSGSVVATASEPSSPPTSAVTSSSVTDDDGTTSSGTDNMESSQPRDSASDHPDSFSSIEGRTSQTQQAVGGNHVVVGLGTALGGLALVVVVAGFFVSRKRSSGVKDKEIISPDDDVDGNLFIADTLLPSTDDVNSDDKTFAVIPLKPSRSTASKASQKSAGSCASHGGNEISSVASRLSTKSSKSAKSTATERLLLQVKRTLGASSKESEQDVAARTTVSADTDDIEMILGLNSFESNHSRKSKQKMKTPTPSFGLSEENHELTPYEQTTVKSAEKFVKCSSILKNKAKNEAKVDEHLKKSVSMPETEVSRSDEKSRSEIPLPKGTSSDVLLDEEPQNDLKRTSSSLMSLVSWGKKDKSKGKAEEKWAAALDEASGKTYYYNEETQETTWVKPEGFVEESANKHKFSFRPKDLEQTDSSEGEWKVATDKFSGKPYYFNTLTLQTTWTKPEGFVDSDEGSEY